MLMKWLIVISLLLGISGLQKIKEKNYWLWANYFIYNLDSDNLWVREQSTNVLKYESWEHMNEYIPENLTPEQKARINLIKRQSAVYYPWFW